MCDRDGRVISVGPRLEAFAQPSADGVDEVAIRVCLQVILEDVYLEWCNNGEKF